MPDEMSMGVRSPTSQRLQCSWNWRVRIWLLQSLYIRKRANGSGASCPRKRTKLWMELPVQVDICQVALLFLPLGLL